MSSHHRSHWNTGYGSTKETLVAFIGTLPTCDCECRQCHRCAVLIGQFGRDRPSVRPGIVRAQPGPRPRDCRAYQPEEGQHVRCARGTRFKGVNRADTSCLGTMYRTNGDTGLEKLQSKLSNASTVETRTRPCSLCTCVCRPPPRSVGSVPVSVPVHRNSTSRTRVHSC